MLLLCFKPLQSNFFTPVLKAGDDPSAYSLSSRGLKGISKHDGYFDEFILIVINEALNDKKELHENGIDSNDVIHVLLCRLMCD